MTKIVKHKESQTGLSIRVKTELGLSKSLNDLIYCDTEPSFALLRRDHGDTDVRLMLLSRIQLMLKRVGGSLNDEQIEYFINDVILKEFYHYNISDINLIERRISGLKIFGSVKIQDIISQFEAHDLERTEMAMIRSKDKDSETELKTRAVIPKEVMDNLHKMINSKIKKEKVDKLENPPPLSKEARESNDDKIEELKRRFPDSKI